jgi:hypothetical protein
MTCGSAAEAGAGRREGFIAGAPSRRYQGALVKNAKARVLTRAFAAFGTTLWDNLTGQRNDHEWMVRVHPASPVIVAAASVVKFLRR